MTRQLVSSSLLALALMVGTACLLGQVRAHQRLGPPGVKTNPVPGSIRLHAQLPEQVLDYQSKETETEDIVLSNLPKDTSFGSRHYEAPDGFWLDLRVVLMGHDRTSLHKPQFCLTGQGWRINDFASSETKVNIDRPCKYELPIVKLVASRTLEVDGRNQQISGVYVYWYVAGDAMSASTLGVQRMWWMATKLLRTGVLQRWAYVSCFAPCPPGQESAAFERIRSFIAAAVPQFQLYPSRESLANGGPLPTQPDAARF